MVRRRFKTSSSVAPDRAVWLASYRMAIFCVTSDKRTSSPLGETRTMRLPARETTCVRPEGVGAQSWNLRQKIVLRNRSGRKHFHSLKGPFLQHFINLYDGEAALSALQQVHRFADVAHPKIPGQRGMFSGD